MLLSVERGIFIMGKTDALTKEYLENTIVADDRTAYCVVGIENPAEIHYALPVKNGVYDFLQLSHQIRETVR